MLDTVGEPHHCNAEAKAGTQEHRLSAGFHVHEGQKQAKLTSGVRSQVYGCPGIRHKGVLGAGYMGGSENP